MYVNRRRFLTSATAAAVGVSLLPYLRAATAKPARYRRYNVQSVKGRAMLKSYEKGIEAMLKLPADHPLNWFRYAFIHLMDCPHGNWWFYVWHRGYVGYFEQAVRELSGDREFALPYWDWTTLPQIPDPMFDGYLTPTGAGFAPYTGNLAKFTALTKDPLSRVWQGFSADQLAQLKLRGYSAFGDLWNDVTGYSPASKGGISGNESFATTCAARYLSRDNPKLDEKTTYDVSPFVVYAGLQVTDFNNPTNVLSFTSSRTKSHNDAPANGNVFSTLEGLPHNKVHNCIGGVGPLDPGPYGNMTNFLSPVDPIFMLHHGNMDRLWDVWTRKQQSLGLPYLPDKDDLAAFADEPFLFFVDGSGHPVPAGKAGDYIDTSVFDYDYEPGFGEDLIHPSVPQAKSATVTALFSGSVAGSAGSVQVSREAITATRAARPAAIIASITIPRPTGTNTQREFDVLVNAPDGVTAVNASSPYYAGTVAFFGTMMPGMAMGEDATFSVPMRPALQAFAEGLERPQTELKIKIVPSNGAPGEAPPLKALSLRAL